MWDFLCCALAGFDTANCLMPAGFPPVPTGTSVLPRCDAWRSGGFVCDTSIFAVLPSVRTNETVAATANSPAWLFSISNRPTVNDGLRRCQHVYSKLISGRWKWHSHARRCFMPTFDNDPHCGFWNPEVAKYHQTPMPVASSSRRKNALHTFEQWSHPCCWLPMCVVLIYLTKWYEMILNDTCLTKWY